MNKLIYKICLPVSIIMLVFFSCKSTPTNSYTFKHGNKKIELQIPQNQIILDEETSAILKLTNINAKELVIVGVGVSIKNVSETECNILIKTRSEFFVNKKNFELRVSYNENGEKIKHIFYIPLKNSAINNMNR